MDGSPSWTLLVSSHIFRSVLDWSQKGSLDFEISGLRLEVHRARELVASFNQSLEACEWQNSWLRVANQALLLVLTSIVLSGLVLFAWNFWAKAGAQGECKVEAIEAPGPTWPSIPVARTGPGRPSDRVRSVEPKP